MTFSELNAAVVDLRNSLRSFVGDSALEEVTVRPPAGDSDEASFLRLVSWSYALMFEAGRVAIPYLLKLRDGSPSVTTDPKAAYKFVRSLRTWSSHNLGFASNRDVALLRHVQLWFVKTCGANPPIENDSWQKCFLILCGEIKTVVTHCQGAVTVVLDAPDDGKAAIADLQQRIDRAWPAHRFDALVQDVALRLGIQVDARKFREPLLSIWRGFLESLSDDVDLEERVIRMIEKDLLEHDARVLPIDARDVMSTLNLNPGPEVGAALHHAQDIFRSGIRDREKLLTQLRNDFLQNEPQSEVAAGGAMSSTRAVPVRVLSQWLGWPGG